jgi:glucokinase
MAYLGIDLGGTNTKAGVCTDQGKVLASDSIPTNPHLGPMDTLARIASLAESLIGKTRISVCGIGVPGPLDRNRTELLAAPNLTWTNVRIPSLLQKALGIPTIMENDANCAAFGESRAWPACDGFVLYTLGTGVGGGILLKGELWVGASGAAGELGHVTIDPHGPLCGCGKRGCVETYSSAKAVALAAGMSAQEAFASRRREAKEAIDRAVWGLGVAISNVINVLHPDLVVLAGGMAAAGKSLIAPVRAEVRKRVFPVHLEKIRIELSRLGDEAGWMGAALWAARKHHDRKNS